MDTGNDPRFVVLDKAIADVKRTFEMGRVKKAIDKHKVIVACDNGHRALMTLRYCYAEPAQIKAMPEFATLEGVAGDIEAILGGPHFEEQLKDSGVPVFQVAWTVSTIRSLGARLDLAGNELENGIDVAAGRVVSAHAHPQADNLLACRVGAGRALMVVTNDKTVKTDDKVGVSMLPPVELRGIISQGMFLGAGKGILKNVEGGPLGRPNVPAAAYGETRSMLKQYVEHKT